MLSPEEKEIYGRHLILDEIGIEGQLKLKASRVLVIGAGGLGCPVLQYICAAGVGKIGIADHDTVNKSNLQRQILYSFSSVGKSKAEEAKKRLEGLNPYTKIITYNSGVNAATVLEIISDYDIVVDCTDNYQTRYLVNDACVLKNKTLVYGAIHKFEGQVSVFNYNNGPSYRCLYPEVPKAESISNCSESGVIGVLPGIIGTLQANEVIKIIIGIGTPLNGKLLLFNALNNQIYSFNIVKKEHDIYPKIKQLNALDPNIYQINCGTFEIREVELEKFLQIKHEFIQIVDVRENGELPIVENLSSLKIPLSELEHRYSEINPKLKTIIYCKTGIRSKKAIEILSSKYGYKNIYNLKGGILPYLSSPLREVLKSEVAYKNN